MHTSGVRGIDWQTLTVSYSPLLITEPWALFRQTCCLLNRLWGKFLIRTVLWEGLCRNRRQYSLKERKIQRMDFGWKAIAIFKDKLMKPTQSWMQGNRPEGDKEIQRQILFNLIMRHGEQSKVKGQIWLHGSILVSRKRSYQEQEGRRKQICNKQDKL